MGLPPWSLRQYSMRQLFLLQNGPKPCGRVRQLHFDPSLLLHCLVTFHTLMHSLNITTFRPLSGYHAIPIHFHGATLALGDQDLKARILSLPSRDSIPPRNPSLHPPSIPAFYDTMLPSCSTPPHITPVKS